MPGDQATDSIRLDSLFLPYDRLTASLRSEPYRIVDGLNAYVSASGTLTRRPGLIKIANTEFGSRYRPYRLYLYETMAGIIYVLCSAYDNTTGLYSVLYNRLNSGSPGWNTIPETRSCNGSLTEHEIVVARGLAFIRYTHATEKYCSVIFDGSKSPVETSFWGVVRPDPVSVYAKRVKLNTAVNTTDTSWTVSPESNMFNDSDFDGGLPPSASYDTPYEGIIDDEIVTITNVVDAGGGNATLTVTRAASDTTAKAHVANTWLFVRKFASSTRGIQVKNLTGWQYCMCYETRTGHLSSRSNVHDASSLYETSKTERFKDKIPRMYVQGHSDTTQVPYIVIGRTSDGGGTFLRLARIASEGSASGSQQFLDDDMPLETGGAASGTDPTTDASLSIADQMPSTTSNDPPPMVNAPLVTGTDTPVNSGPLAYFASRIWMPIENLLHASSNEEIKAGVPEECWKSGLGGNNWRFAGRLVNQQPTTDANYLFTADDSHILTGSDASTFNIRPKWPGVGAALNHPSAICRTRRGIAWAAQDYRIMLYTESTGNLRAFSDALKNDISNMVANSGARLFLNTHTYLEKEWLVVTACVQNSPSNSRTWILDISLSERTERPFWNVPWALPAICTVSGRYREDVPLSQMIFAVYTDISAGTQAGHLAYLDMNESTWTDDTPAGDNIPYEWFVKLSPLTVPVGNHVNTAREPGIAPALLDVIVEETEQTSIWQPVRCILYRDRLTNGVEEIPPRQPAHTDPTEGYTSNVYESWRIGKRVSIELRQDAVPWPLEVQSITIRWAPESGGSV